jgi:hypothetical protein
LPFLLQPFRLKNVFNAPNFLRINVHAKADFTAYWQPLQPNLKTTYQSHFSKKSIILLELLAYIAKILVFFSIKAKRLGFLE